MKLPKPKSFSRVHHKNMIYVSKTLNLGLNGTFGREKENKGKIMSEDFFFQTMCWEFHTQRKINADFGKTFGRNILELLIS